MSVLATGIDHILQFLGDAFGQGVKLVAVRDAVGNEIARKAIASALVDGQTLIVDAVFNPGEATGELAKVVLFAGAAADPAVPDSGIAFADVVPDAPISKTAEDELTFSFEVKVVSGE